MIDVQIQNEKRIKDTLDKEHRDQKKLEEMKIINMKRNEEEKKNRKKREEMKKLKHIEENKRIDKLYKLFEMEEKRKNELDFQREKNKFSEMLHSTRK